MTMTPSGLEREYDDLREELDALWGDCDNPPRAEDWAAELYAWLHYGLPAAYILNVVHHNLAAYRSGHINWTRIWKRVRKDCWKKIRSIGKRQCSAHAVNVGNVTHSTDRP